MTNTTEPGTTTSTPEAEGERSADTPESEGPAQTADPDTFPREYVEKLRAEAADARVRAKRADDLARDLFAARVTATGRLADPSDLDYDEALLDDAEALDAAVDDLLATKPHLASRTPRGDVGQGITTTETTDLAAILRANA
ncbi:MAG: hypothetical protein ACK5KO_12975 [Arachnia sp.]